MKLKSLWYPRKVEFGGNNHTTLPWLSFGLTYHIIYNLFSQPAGDINVYAIVSYKLAFEN